MRASALFSPGAETAVLSDWQTVIVILPAYNCHSLCGRFHLSGQSRPKQSCTNVSCSYASPVLFQYIRLVILRILRVGIWGNKNRKLRYWRSKTIYPLRRNTGRHGCIYRQLLKMASFRILLWMTSNMLWTLQYSFLLRWMRPDKNTVYLFRFKLKFSCFYG